jgi:dolichol-phosphate mannosyltransferase
VSLQGHEQQALVIVPTYNEIENIAQLVCEILAQPAPLHILIVDDNSPDGTGAAADALAEADPRVRVAHRPAKLGLGTAYVCGFARALADGYGYAITMDADFSHNPRYLPGLLALAQAHDIAIGSRYVRGGGARGCTWPRVLLSRGANAIARGALGLRTRDCTAGFRCYRADVLRAIDPQSILSSGYSFLVEMVTRCERQGYRIAELPIVFDNRQRGASKISKAEIYRSVFTIVRLRLTWLPWHRGRAHHRPAAGATQAH